MDNNISAPDNEESEHQYSKFINEKPFKILAVLENESTENYGQAIRDQVDSTYSHTLKTLKQFEEDGLVESEQKGRKKIYRLTEEGRELADDCKPWFERLNFNPSRGTRSIVRSLDPNTIP